MATPYENIESTLREVLVSSMTNAMKNAFPEILRQVREKTTPEVLADLYPHEVLTLDEIAEITREFAADCVSSAIRDLNCYEAAKMMNSILA